MLANRDANTKNDGTHKSCFLICHVTREDIFPVICKIYFCSKETGGKQ